MTPSAYVVRHQSLQSTVLLRTQDSDDYTSCSTYLWNDNWVWNIYCLCQVKTESIRNLSNFNFQWPKTLYQNNSKHIAFFFAFFDSYGCNLLSVITPKTICYGSPRKQISNFTKWNLTHKNLPILPVFTQFLWNLKFNSMGSHKKLSLVLLQITNYVYSS